MVGHRESKEGNNTKWSGEGGRADSMSLDGQSRAGIFSLSADGSQIRVLKPTQVLV